MKIEFLTNNSLSFELANWLKDTAKEEVVIFDQKLTPKIITQHSPDLVVSYNYKYIIPANILMLLPNRFINLHVSLLPWNRGADPNFWSFIDDSPKGVTIHLIDEGMDTGDILLQKEVKFEEEKETLASSYNKLHQIIQDLFRENWMDIKDFKIQPQKQPKKGGSVHYLKDFSAIKGILGNEGWNISLPILKKKYDELK